MKDVKKEKGFIFLVLMAVVGLYFWVYYIYPEQFRKKADEVVVSKIGKAEEVVKDKVKSKIGLINTDEIGSSSGFFDKVKNKFSKLVNWDMSDKYTKTESGLEYKIIKKGNSSNHPDDFDQVSVNYVGEFEDGKIFETTYKNGTIDLYMDSIIKGLNEGLKMMSPGDVYEFRIPPELGYGEFDYYDIPGGSTLIFKIELVDIK